MRGLLPFSKAAGRLLGTSCAGQLLARTVIGARSGQRWAGVNPLAGLWAWGSIRGLCKHHQQQTHRSRRPRIDSCARSRPLGISTSRQVGSMRPCGLGAYLAIE
jgi:hypothetical protein